MSLVSQIKTQEAQALLQTLGNDTLCEGAEAGKQTGTDENWEEKYKELAKANASLELENTELRQANATLVKEKAKMKELKQLKPIEETELEEDMLRDSDDYDQFCVVEKYKWPKAIFKSAYMTSGSQHTTGKDADILVLHEEGEEKYNTEANKELERSLQERFPELRDLEGKVTAININTKIIKSGLKAIGSDRWVVRAELDLDEGGRGWFNTLVMIRKMMVDGGRTKLLVYPPSPDPEGRITRKVAEYIFRATEIKCLIHIKPQATEQSPRRNIRRTTDALVLRQSGRSYSDLLKTIRATVKPDMASAKAIRTIRETKNGEMVVVLDRDAKATEELRSELNKIQDVNIKSMKANNDTTIFINDIDALANKDKIVQSICGELGTIAECVYVGELRKSYGGNQTTIVSLPHQEADKLLAKGRLRIGLSWCPIKERVEVVKCFRCWKYGHLSRDRKETADESKLCRKCGGGGHEAKGCNRTDFCLMCKQEGHTSGSGGCPEFRKAIARERIKKKDRRRF